MSVWAGHDTTLTQNLTGGEMCSKLQAISILIETT